MSFNPRTLATTATIIAVAAVSLTLAGCTSNGSTHPTANASAAADSSYRVVPKVIGLTVTEARKKLIKAGVTARTSQPGTKWKVTAQSPAAGTKAPRGSAVEIEPYELKQK